MQINIRQISNGWVLTILMPDGKSSGLYCATMADCMAQLVEISNQEQAAIKAAKEQKLKEQGI